MSRETREQPALFNAPTEPAPPRVTDRQQKVLDYVNAHPDGVSADEAGALTHRHGLDSRCDYCARSGTEVLGALVRKGLVIRRKSREPGTTGYQYVPATGGGGAGPMGTAGRPGFDSSGFPVEF